MWQRKSTSRVRSGEDPRNLLWDFATFELEWLYIHLPVAQNDSEIEILRVYRSVAHGHPHTCIYSCTTRWAHSCLPKYSIYTLVHVQCIGLQSTHTYTWIRKYADGLTVISLWVKLGGGDPQLCTGGMSEYIVRPQHTCWPKTLLVDVCSCTSLLDKCI